jgi:hypothetical protein
VKGRHFDTTEMIEAESQAVPRNLTEHDFHDVFKKNDQSAGNCAYARKETISKVVVVVASWAKVNF